MLNKDDIRQMQQTMTGDVLSVYLHVDSGYRENQATTPAWRIHLKNALRDIEQNLTEEQESHYRAVHDQLEQFLGGYEPSSKSLVLFITSEQVVSYELPVELENTAQYGDPLLVPLLWAVDEFERYLVVLVDKEKARFLDAYLGRASTSDEMQIDLNWDWRERPQMPPTVATSGSGDAVALRQGNNREQFEDMIAEHTERFHADVAERVGTLAEQTGASRIILGGDERSAHAVQEEMHETVQSKVINVLSIPLRTPDHEISEQIRQAAIEHERGYEYDLVQDVIGLAKADGRAALGLHDIRQALKMQQVELLVLPWPADEEETFSQVTLDALSMGADVELVHGAAASTLKQEANAAARLYYTMEASS